MRRSTYGWLAIASGFAVVLVYATMVTTRAPGRADLARGGPGAVEVCKAAVGAQVPGARFPFATRVLDLGGGRYRLHGMLDERLADEVVRRNYECVVHYDEPVGYLADSVRVWQSH